MKVLDTAAKEICTKVERSELSYLRNMSRIDTC